MNKKFMSICVLSILLLLNGCGEKKKKEEGVKQETTTKIKVTENVVKKDTTKVASKENSGQFYFSYNKANESPEAKEIEKYDKQTYTQKSAIDAYSSIKSPYAELRLHQMIHRLSKNYIVLCSACHSDYANGIIGPSLLGKSKEFIYQRIIDFKTGKRKNVLMKQLVSQISDKKLKNLAAEISKFNQEVNAMRGVK